MDEKQIPQVRVGIMNEPTIGFVLNGDYRVNGTTCSGAHQVQCVDGQVEWNGNRYSELLFEPVDVEKASFTLKAVTNRWSTCCVGGTLPSAPGAW